MKGDKGGGMVRDREEGEGLREEGRGIKGGGKWVRDRGRRGWTQSAPTSST